MAELKVVGPQVSRGDPAPDGFLTKVRRRWGHQVPLSLYLYPLPALVLFVIFFAIPALQALQYALTNWDGYSASFDMVGVKNFVTIFTGDTLFRNAVRNNLVFVTVVVLAQTVVSLLLAILLTRNTRMSIFLRALFFFPTILSSVSVAFIWKFMYDPNYGLLNQGLGAVGLDGLQQAYLAEARTAIVWVALTQVWFHAGQLMVIFIAGLQSIPAEFYESARIDGASPWRQFTDVTWPLIAPATVMVVAYTTIQSFKAFDLIIGLGGNPPSGALDILSTRIYSTFANSQFGYAAAESVVFMLLIGALTILQRRLLAAIQRG